MSKERQYLPGGSYHHGAWYPAYIPEDEVNYIDEKLSLSADDVMVAGYPKSGTTWTEEIVSLLWHNGNVDEAHKKPIFERVITLEVKNKQSGVDKIERSSPPRITKTHLPYKCVKRIIEEDQPKVIYVVRNPKDTLVSYYHFHRMTKLLDNYQGTWHDFFDIFKEKLMATGDWFDHVTGWWAERHRANIFFVKYEDLLTKQRETISAIARFLQIELESHVLDRIVSHTGFQSMKSNPATNFALVNKAGMFNFDISPFMRKGKMGDWKNYFTEEQNEYFDRLYSERMDGNGLELQFQ